MSSALMKIAILTSTLYKFYYCLFEIQRGCDFGLELQKTPKLPHIHARFNYDGNEQS